MTTETNFTPGPWRYNVATNGEVVAPQERGPDVTVVEADSASPSNSRLIAAAPELYEALDKLANGEPGCHWDTGLIPRIEKARKALAKARGDTQ